MDAPRRAIIGHTGFVGSTLNVPGRFTAAYNSANSASMAGQSFDQIVCAGVSAAKWIANADPDADWASISRLTEVLEKAEARQFVLISTIDVYLDPSADGDESTVIDGERNHAYGRNRLRLENWAKGHFADCRTIRLPALYGHGLRKNALYDLLRDNQVDRINPLGVFQWYPTARLWADIETTLETGLNLVNLFTEAVSMSAIVERCFPDARLGEERRPAPHYCVKTRHAEIFGGGDGYVMSAGAVLADIERFVASERGQDR